MGSSQLPHKLTAILYADVAGYSRLTGEDEEGTHRRLSEYLDLISAFVESHHGRVVHYAGDAVLADFGSVINALSSAVAIQRELKIRNDKLPSERELPFRIGVNLGEVIIDRDDIYGDGVNIAARLESVAEPGGICISGAVYDAVGTRLALDYELLDQQKLKNIAQSVRVYRVRSKSDSAPYKNSKSAESVELPSKPSIAVLPFANMSGDSDQEYFADGITEDLITALSRFRWFVVTSRSSIFTYKNKPVDVKQAAQELGVRYVLEGSVRKVGSRVRISAQLIDATTDIHLWAERYDREIEDIFSLQDEITGNIVTAIAPELSVAEGERSERKNAATLGAWDYMLRAQMHIYRWTPEDMAIAERLATKAVEMDASSAHGYKALAWSQYSASLNGWCKSRSMTMRAAREAAEKAVALDDKDAHSRQILGSVHLAYGDHELAISEMQTAIELNPSFVHAYANLAVTLTYAGRPNEAISLYDKAVRLNPRNADLSYLRCCQSLTNLMLGEYVKAFEFATQAIQNRKTWIQGRCFLVSSLAQAGKLPEAKVELEKLLNLDATYSIENAKKANPFKNPADFDRLAEGLRLAGLS